MKKLFLAPLIGISSLAMSAGSVFAASGGDVGGHGDWGPLLLMFGLLLLAAKLGGAVEKLGLPSVLGELFAGIALSMIGFAGLSFIDEIRHNQIIGFLAEIGAIILLFQIGLESNIQSLVKVGPSALGVAIIGVVAPFLFGAFLIGPVFFADAPLISHLFIGASMVATSVGITASVFKGLGILKTRSCQTVLGAAVIDDVLGLLVLAIVSSLASGAEFNLTSVALLSAQAFAFLLAAVLLGSLLAKPISQLFSKINTGTGMKLSVALVFALLYAYGATLVGLAPIIGAFAAGLILDAVHFDMFDSPAIVRRLKKLAQNEELHKIIKSQQHTHVEDMVSSLGMVFVPLFFAFTGLQIEISSLMNPQVYLIALIVTVGAVLTKLVGGIAAKGSFQEKLLVGMSMVPRGEVGLIFAATGKALGAIDDAVFSTIVLVVIFTTVIAPPVISKLSTQTANKNVAKKKLAYTEKSFA